MRELGYVEGQNIAYEYRYGDGAPDRLAMVAAELVRHPVDLIATYGTPATYATKEAAMGQTSLTYSGAPRATRTESCKAQTRRTCRWSYRRSLISR